MSKSLSPIVMADTFQTLAVDGSEYTVDSQKLRNPNRTPMWVDSIGFGVRSTLTAVQNRTFALGAQFLADIKLGSIPLTLRSIPISSFAPSYLAILRELQDQVWFLPKPLYVPPTVPLHIKITQKLPVSGASALALTFSVSASGRSISKDEPIPEQINVPWVGATSVYNAVTSFTSNDADLGNPHREPLVMTRLCGWNAQIANLARPGGNTNQWYINRAPDFSAQLTYSSGKMLVRDPVPFFMLFPPERGFFNCRALLQPKEFIRAQLDMTAVGNGVGADDLRFTTLGVQGYREIATPRGADGPYRPNP